MGTEKAIHICGLFQMKATICRGNVFLKASSPLDSYLGILDIKRGKEKSFACEKSISKTSAEHAEGSWSLVEVGDKKVSKQDPKQVCSKQPMLSLVSTHTTQVLNENK